MASAAILVAGAGPVGLTAALALRRGGHAVTVIDAKGGQQALSDPRAVALSHGSRLILQRVGVWPAISATPVKHIVVSQQGGFGRTRIESADHRLPALGHIARLGPLTAVLREAARAAGIELLFDSPLESVEHAGTAADACATVRVGGAGRDATRTASLVLHAEGAPGATALSRDYGQTAIVTEAWPREAHEWRAQERFTPQGPLALLPLETGMSIVWCMHPDLAAQLLPLADDAFIARLDAATRFAKLTWLRVAPRHAFPLSLRKRAPDPHPCELSLGNAAQALHPVAGQGLNLGLRDAFELSQALERGVNAAALGAYRRRRRADRDAMIATTDAYVSLFSNDFAPLRMARGLGLALVDVLPPVRAFVARRMMFGVRT